MKKYQVIYADPPWRYDFSKSDSREIENQYPTMSIDEIKVLQIPSEKNAVLYMWTTTAKLVQSLEVMKAWGFEYKSSLIWDKLVYGMGYWFRGQHEFLLVGVKGKFSPPPQPLRIRSVFQEKRTKHSKKPAKIRELIQAWFPDCSRLELFAREKVEGWDSWGDEINSDIEI